VAQAAIGAPPRPCPFIPIRSWTEAGRRVRRPGLQGIFFGGNPSGSGIGPERALEANKPIPSRGSAKADPSQSLLSERRPGPAERPHDVAHASSSARGPKPDAGSGDPAYKGQWVKAGRRVGRPGLQGIFFGGNPSGSGIGPEQALEANKPIPSRGCAIADPSQSLLSERRRDPAERPHDHAHSSPSAHGPKPDAGSGDPAYKGSSSGETQRQRDRAGASLGGEQTHPLARQRES
jgi:hypothetical protein